jgi:hypothetical protein
MTVHHLWFSVTQLSRSNRTRIGWRWAEQETGRAKEISPRLPIALDYLIIGYRGSLRCAPGLLVESDYKELLVKRHLRIASALIQPEC